MDRRGFLGWLAAAAAVAITRLQRVLGRTAPASAQGEMIRVYRVISLTDGRLVEGPVLASRVVLETEGAWVALKKLGYEMRKDSIFLSDFPVRGVPRDGARVPATAVYGRL